MFLSVYFEVPYVYSELTFLESMGPALLYYVLAKIFVPIGRVLLQFHRDRR